MMRHPHRGSNDAEPESLTRMPCVACRQQYDVDLVVTRFDFPLWEAIDLVQSTDVFIGMHGAGFTNLLALHQVDAHGQRLRYF